MKTDFRNALASQANTLSDLAIESKGHWGYSRTQLDVWRKDLRIEEEYIERNSVQAIYSEDQLVGFFAIKKGKEENCLDHLWLLPEAIGKGIGKLVFERIVEECIALSIEEFLIISDPDAEGFYLRQGAERIGEVESIPQKRMLPKLKYCIEQSK